MRATTFKDPWDVDSDFIVSLPQRLIPDSPARLIHMLKTNTCNILFTLSLKSFYRLDFIFSENVVIGKKIGQRQCESMRAQVRA